MNAINVLIFIYLTGVVTSFIIIYIITQEKPGYRMLGAVLIAMTWPLSLIPALFFSLL